MMLLAINSSPKLSSKISVEKRISSVVTGRQGAARAAGGTGGPRHGGGRRFRSGR